MGKQQKIVVAKETEVAKIVNHNDFAERRDSAQKVFSILCGKKLDEDLEIPEKIFGASAKVKLEFIKKNVMDGSHEVKNNIVELSEILLSEKGIQDQGNKKDEPILEVKPIEVKKLRTLALDLILKQTARMRATMKNKVAVSKLSPKAQSASAFLNNRGKFVNDDGPFGCQTGTVAEAVAAFLGEKIHLEDSDEDENRNFQYQIFGMVVAHGDITLITTIDVDNENQGIDIDGAWDSDITSSAHIASDEECRKWVNKISADTLRKFFSFLELR